MSTANSQTKRRKSRKKSNATILAHRKFRWLEQLSADPLVPLLSLRVCIQIAARANLDHGGVAVIAQDTLAAKFGVQRETINRALRSAVELGHLDSIRRGRDKPNGYRMVLKDETQAAQQAPHDVTDSITSSPSRCDDSVPYDVTESVTQTPIFSPGAPTEPPGEGERRRSYERDSSPGGGPAADAAPRQKEDSPTAASLSGRESPIERSPSVAREERFDELRAIWARPWADDVAADQRAFEMACRRSRPDDIIAAAVAWVAAADARRFLPPLARWLANRGWEKPPPMKARRSHGNGRHNGNGRGPVANVFFEIAGYEQDADGNWMEGGQ
jgi:hypothetical protein